MRDLVVLYEHPEWQKPLFAALEKRGVSFRAYDVKRNVFADVDEPRPSSGTSGAKGPLYFNQASPSAYLRGNTRAVPLALAYLRQLQWQGHEVINGADVFAFELSKSAQSAMLQTLGIDHPRGLAFNDLGALKTRLAQRHERDAHLAFPALLKPEQGGSGARIQVVDRFEDIEAAFTDAARRGEDPWAPDNLYLLQEYLPHDPDVGITRLEFVGGELLYAMRVVTHGRFNLCPAPVCNPDDGDPSNPGAGACAIPSQADLKPVEFYAFKDVPKDAVETAQRIVRAAGIDIGGIEYLETPDGRRCFYDINANSNLRPSVAQAFGGFDPFERVVDYLEQRLAG